MTTTPDTTRLRALLAEASEPHDWSVATLAGHLRILDTDGGIVATVSEESDVRLIVAMRKALPGLLDEVERLRAQVAEAYPRALQAAASLVVRDVYGSDLEPGLADEIADGILDLSNEEIDAFAAQSEADHAAAQVAEHYVCPGCHVVDDEPCLPGCIDAEIEGERRTPFDGFSEFNADDGDDEPEEGGTP